MLTACTAAMRVEPDVSPRDGEMMSDQLKSKSPGTNATASARDEEAVTN